MLVTAVQAGGCLGWNLAIDDPDQDPERAEARRIIGMVEQVASALTR